MGIVRTVEGEDGLPYISIEDLISEVEEVSNSDFVRENSDPNKPNFIDLVLKTLIEMEEEYYNRYLFSRE